MSEAPPHLPTADDGVARARRARWAVTAAFATNGALLGALIPHYPEAKAAFGLDPAAFGLLVIALAVGGTLAGPLPAPILRRFGARRVMLAGSVAIALLTTAAGLVLDIAGAGAGAGHGAGTAAAWPLWVFAGLVVASGVLDAVERAVRQGLSFGAPTEREIELAEEILVALWKLIGAEISTPIPRMTYAEAMEKYGSDKPDLRFGLELTDLTEYFKDTPFRVFQNEYVGAVVMPGGASQARRTLDAWQEWAKQRGAKGLAYVLIQEDGELTGPVSKNISEEEKAGLAAAVGANPGDCVFFAAGKPKESRALLGAARVEIGRRCGLFTDAGDGVAAKDADWAFVWVVDAPMFEPAADAVASGDVAVGAGAWTAVHHAFTSPKPEFADTFDTDPGSALAYAYDIVCNGNEIGGGSIRIHRQDVQERVFEVMGLSPEEANEKFGFLLEGFKYGAPPHGGIAFGWDRVVALLAGTDSIREVIAFPKTGGGFDPLTAAPAPITAQQRKEAGVDAQPEPKQAEAEPEA